MVSNPRSAIFNCELGIGITVRHESTLAKSRVLTRSCAITDPKFLFPFLYSIKTSLTQPEYGLAQYTFAQFEIDLPRKGLVCNKQGVHRSCPNDPQDTHFGVNNKSLNLNIYKSFQSLGHRKSLGSECGNLLQVHYREKNTPVPDVTSIQVPNACCNTV